MSLNNIINNLNFDAIPAQYLVNQDGEPIEVRYAGNYTDPENQLSYFVYATNDRTPIFVPQPLAPHQYPVFHAQQYQDDYPADPMNSPRPQSPRPQRQRTSRQESARQRRLTRRAARREAMQQFRESQVQRNLFANPGNIFMNPEPMEPMQRPASPVRQQAPNPNSRRTSRRQRQQRQQQRQQQQSNVISQRPYNRVVGGAKTKRRCRRY
jgi:hypothetical protein